MLTHLLLIFWLQFNAAQCFAVTKHIQQSLLLPYTCAKHHLSRRFLPGRGYQSNCDFTYFAFFTFFSVLITFWITILLLSQAGDVHPNPGKPKSKSFVRRSWSYDKGNNPLLREMASSIIWENLYDPDVNKHALNLSNQITSLAMECIPNRLTRIRPGEPYWINSGIKRLIRKRKRAYRKAKRSGILQHWNKFRFRSYLTDRKQRVVLPGAESEWTYIRAGVPQGSILGPLLFLLFINDIVDEIGCHIRLFADDTSLYITVENPDMAAELLNIDLDKIMKWAKKWLVLFKPVKTESFLASRKLIKPLHPPLFMEGSQIMEVESHKHLGIFFSHDSTCINI